MKKNTCTFCNCRKHIYYICAWRNIYREITSSSTEESLARFSFNVKGCMTCNKFEDIHYRLFKSSVRTIYIINFEAVPRHTRNSDLSSTCASHLPSSRNWIIYAPKHFTRRKRESVIVWLVARFSCMRNVSLSKSGWNAEEGGPHRRVATVPSTGDPFVAVDRAADDRYQQAGYIVGCAREDIYESLSQSFTRFGNTRGKEREKGRERERGRESCRGSRNPDLPANV